MEPLQDAETLQDHLSEPCLIWCAATIAQSKLMLIDAGGNPLLLRLLEMRMVPKNPVDHVLLCIALVAAFAAGLICSELP
ncbi:hypothetical protein [Microvirga arsenatis]|uniref:Uncharacterized protein n=1 Tax=Microvirga arsenatis TaxID=2692265 RepID=A0ABW9YZC3_9HYPH|nr:hypothetical protein [Microvirga arsenatis]NBJ10649.1 hypothetical protein [Microvirga arsenatis]NBJ24453.1 hypothetical protein [Microvirga arsenatis]